MQLLLSLACAQKCIGMSCCINKSVGQGIDFGARFGERCPYLLGTKLQQARCFTFRQRGWARRVTVFDVVHDLRPFRILDTNRRLPRGRERRREFPILE